MFWPYLCSLNTLIPSLDHWVDTSPSNTSKESSLIHCPQPRSKSSSPWSTHTCPVACLRTSLDAHILSALPILRVCVCVCVCTRLVAHSCLTLWDPMDYSPPGSSVCGILQARTLEWVAMPSSRGSSQPRNQTRVSCLWNWQAGSLSLVPPEKPPTYLKLPQLKHFIWFLFLPYEERIPGPCILPQARDSGCGDEPSFW